MINAKLTVNGQIYDVLLKENHLCKNRYQMCGNNLINSIFNVPNPPNNWEICLTSNEKFNQVNYYLHLCMGWWLIMPVGSK